MQPDSVATHLDAVEAQAKKLNGITSMWAEAALLSLVTNLDTSPEARAEAIRSLEAGWSEPAAPRPDLVGGSFDRRPQLCRQSARRGQRFSGLSRQCCPSDRP